MGPEKEAAIFTRSRLPRSPAAGKLRRTWGTAGRHHRRGRSTGTACMSRGKPPPAAPARHPPSPNPRARLARLHLVPPAPRPDGDEKGVPGSDDLAVEAVTNPAPLFEGNGVVRPPAPSFAYQFLHCDGQHADVLQSVCSGHVITSRQEKKEAGTGASCPGPRSRPGAGIPR